MHYSYSEHVESGDEGGSTDGDLGGSFFSGVVWVLAVEDLLLELVSWGSTIGTRADSGDDDGIDEISAACGFLSADGFVGTTGLTFGGGDGGDKSNGEEFHFKLFIL